MFALLAAAAGATDEVQSFHDGYIKGFMDGIEKGGYALFGEPALVTGTDGPQTSGLRGAK